MHRHRATLGIVFLIVFIDLVGFGIVIPFLPLYAETYRPSPAVFGLLMASFSIMQFVAAPILGRLSDRYGWRPIFLVSLAGSVVGYLLFAFAGSLTVLFLSRIVDGISGGNIATAQAVIADITDEKNRTRGMGIIGAAFGLGFICGPGIGGLLAGVATWLPGVAAAVTSGTALILVALVLAETAPEERRERRSFPLTARALRGALAHPLVGAALAMVFLIIFAFSNFETTFAQFGQARFGFTTASIGWLFVYAGVLGAIIQGGLAGALARRFGEGRLVAVGTLLACFALAVLPQLDRMGWLLGALAVLALGQGMASPSLSALASKLVAGEEVGGVMGIYQSLSSLGRIVGPFWAELAYGSWGASWPFRSGAVAMLAASTVGWGVVAAMRRRGREAARAPDGSETGRA